MIRMTLAHAACGLDRASVRGDAVFEGVATDSRAVRPGNLFAALKGQRFDGHRFLAQARQQGAAAALVSDCLDDPLPQLRVRDTRAGLAQLAGFWRNGFDLAIVAVTGSNGKTTVKEMLANILRGQGSTLATAGNLNNDIGVPLTLLGLAPGHRYAVVEMGANHSGEVAALTALAKPTVGLVTNAGPAHLEGFGDLDGVARAKGELFSVLPANGTAVINLDDPYAPLWRALAGARRIVTFGLDASADVRAARAGGSGGPMPGSRFHLSTPVGGADVALALLGQHNVRNALAAAAAAFALDVPLEAIQRALERAAPVRGRLEPRAGVGGALLVDDTYNANPGSLASALQALSEQPGEKMLVLGDMAELGEHGWEWHEQAGRMVRDQGFGRLLAVGDLSRASVEAFGAGARHFPDQPSLAAALVAALHPGVVVLVKGSRCMHMERVVEAIAATEQGPARAVGRG